MGAWIEMFCLVGNFPDFHVAPLVGAWIEIVPLPSCASGLRVAPLVGAWIEIAKGGVQEETLPPSLPLWERGLKL